jgi:predicted metalloprotease
MLLRTVRTTLVCLAAIVTAGSIAIAQARFSDANIRAEIGETQKYLIKKWTAILGSGFKPPGIIYYYKPIKTGCSKDHKIDSGNAFFCAVDNIIYVDTGFIADVDEEAFEKLHSPGNFAGLAIFAHEFGHAIEHYTVFQAVTPTEGGADCFAGATFNSALADGQFPDYALDEAISLMEYIADDTILGINPKSPLQVEIAEVLYGRLDHGTVAERQAAFLRGVYGGANFCVDSRGLPGPPAGIRVLASQSLLPSRSVATPTKTCSVSTSDAGTRVRNNGARGPCVVNLLPAGTRLPDHVRIEVSVTSSPGPVASQRGIAGIHYGDNRASERLTRFGYAPETATDAKVSNIDGQPEVIEPFLMGNWTVGRLPHPTNGAQRLTLDIHHEGKNVYFMEFLNGVAVSHDGLWQHGTRHRRLNLAEFGYSSDEAGLWVREPGSEAVFSDFRVTAIYR